MASKKYRMRAEVQIWPGETANWHLLYLPKKEAEILRQKYKGKERGWSSLPVEVQIGKTKWQTSIFFDRRSDSYILPLKAEVRKKEGLMQGDRVKFSLAIRL
jgi:hypothetical protein